MVASDGHDLARRTGRRNPERIALALHHERRHGYGFELGQAALARLPRARRRLERKCKTEDTGGACCICGPARDARAERAAADDGRKVCELCTAQTLEDGRPDCVELSGGCRRATAGNAIRLLD